ncbi:unnamed protein product [Diamesa tonsa]
MKCVILISILLVALQVNGQIADNIAKPAACPVNQVYRCGFPKTLGFTCEPTCLPVNETCFVIRVACTNGCYCKDGYKLSGNKCVLTCPKVLSAAV